MPRPGAAARGGGADDRRGASCPGTRASQRSSVPPPGGLERRSGDGPAAQKSLGRPSFPREGKSPNDQALTKVGPACVRAVTVRGRLPPLGLNSSSWQAQQRRGTSELCSPGNESCPAVCCGAWILMKALVCEDGGGTQPPPSHPEPEAFSCVPSSRPPTPDSLPASISTPGPSSLSSSTPTARPVSPAACPLSLSPSSAPSSPSAPACSSPASASTPGTGWPTPAATTTSPSPSVTPGP